MSEDEASQGPDPAENRHRRGTWLAVLAVLVGVGFLGWAVTRPSGYATFGWFAPDPASQAILTVSTTSPELVLAALAGGPLLVGLGVGYLVGRGRG